MNVSVGSQIQQLVLFIRNSDFKNVEDLIEFNEKARIIRQEVEKSQEFGDKIKEELTVLANLILKVHNDHYKLYCNEIEEDLNNLEEKLLQEENKENLTSRSLLRKLCDEALIPRKRRTKRRLYQFQGEMSDLELPHSSTKRSINAPVKKRFPLITRQFRLAIGSKRARLSQFLASHGFEMENNKIM